MMKNILTTIALIFLFHAPVSAQYMNLDSLLKALPRYKNPDTARLNLLNNIAFNFHNKNPQKGLETGIEALVLAKQFGYKAKTASSYNNIAVNYISLGKYDSAINNFQHTIELYKAINDKKGLTGALSNMGICYFYNSNYAKASEYYYQSLIIAQELNNEQGIATALGNIGGCFLGYGDYSKSLAYYLKALQFHEKLGNKSGILNCYQNIGELYRYLANFPKAINFMEKCLKIEVELGDTRTQCYSLAGIGQIYFLMNDLPKAIDYTNQSLLISERIPYPEVSAMSYTNLGSIYKKTEDYSKSYYYLQKGIAATEQINDKSSLIVGMEELGNFYLEVPQNALTAIGVRATERFTKAIEMQKKCLLIAKEINSLNLQTVALENLSDIYSKQKDYSNALTTYKEAVSLHDSMYNDKQKNEIISNEMQYEFDKKEALVKATTDKQQALAKAEINRQTVIKNSVMGGTGVLMLSAAFSFAFYKRRRDAEKQKIESDLKAEISDVEMKALRSQMNPHFIFNSLNSISEFVLKNDTKAADNYLSKFAKVMRMILENSEQKEVPLSADLKVLELYMQLEALRMNNKFNYEIEIDPNIDSDNTLIPPLILQPFVENSIWHGISKKEGFGKIKISITKENDMINCTVEDDGVGRVNANRKEGKSLGMKITNERIQLLNKLKKAKAAIALTDLAQGFKVEVKLPLQLSF